MEFNKNFILACNVRPIQAFDPASLLEVDYQRFRAFLSAGSKLTWFYQYCAEQGLTGMVQTRFVSSENLPPIPCTGAEGNVAYLGKEYWEATVYIDEKIISIAQSSQTFMVHSQSERDGISNNLRKAAIGAALSQAGFGIMSSFELADADKAAIMAQMGIDPSALPTAGVTPPSTVPPVSAPAPTQDPFFGGNVPQPTAPVVPPVAPVAPQAAPLAAPVVVPTPPAEQVDPLTAAKNVMWVGSGKYTGQTLGQILSAPEGAKNIRWIAETYKPRSEAAKKMQEAAQLILCSLATGE